jgi:hypothetical protein
MNNPSDDTPKDSGSPVGINSARGQTLILRNTLVLVLAFTSGFRKKETMSDRRRRLIKCEYCGNEFDKFLVTGQG